MDSTYPSTGMTSNSIDVERMVLWSFIRNVADAVSGLFRVIIILNTGGGSNHRRMDDHLIRFLNEYLRKLLAFFC
jgi:hypothetical protein